ncbi:MAG: glycerophosphodiester phosphodiesterase family protein, partial [Methylobacterium sp.]
SAPGWLTARPIAHRGLHDRSAGIPENTIAAAEAAIAGGYAIECDIQPSRDGEAMVFHDEALGRLTTDAAPTASRDATHLSALSVAGTQQRIPTLSEYVTVIAGRTPLIVEIKTQFDEDLSLSRRVAAVIADYPGPVALKSFDPRIVGALADLAEGVPRGIVAERSQEDPSYARLTRTQRFGLANLLHLHQSRPDFVSWRVDDLPGGVPYLCRQLGRMPVMTWTVRTDDQRKSAAAHADQMVFEGFRP